jgi:aminomethyltransferase
MCLYGNEIDENTTPLEASLGFVVKFRKNKFIGKEALSIQKNEGLKRKRVGVQMIGKGVPRPSYELFSNEGEKIGKITSGTFSPLLKIGIGMAYIEKIQAQEGNIVKVKIRGKLLEGRIVPFPFYDRERYGYKRKTID